MERFAENSPRTRRVQDVQTVLAHLMLERTDIAQQGFEAEYHPFQIIVEDTQTGYDLNGDFHCHGVDSSVQSGSEAV